MSSSSSSPQLSSSQLPPSLLSLPSSLPSKPYTQLDATSLLLPVGVGAAALPCVFAASPVIAFQVHQCCFEKYWRGWERHDDTGARVKKFFFHLCIVDPGTITGFLDKLNRTSKAQS